MKIAFLAPFGVRPKGTLTARMIPLAVELQKLGHEIVIIAPPYTNPEDSGRTEVIQGVEVRNIVLAPGNRAVAAIPNALRMLRAVKLWRPDLIHLFKPKGYGGIGAMILILSHKFGFATPPVVVDSDDWEGKGGMNERLGYSSLEQRVYAFQERWLLRHAQAVTAASRALVSLCTPFRPDERVCYLPNGAITRSVLATRGEVRARYGIAEDAPLLLLYTRFFEFSQERLQQALQGLFAAVPDLRVMVIGKGPHQEQERLDAWAVENGVAAAMINCGWLEPAVIADHIAACDCAIYLFDDTLVNRTKCPAKLVEIIGQGVPVVAERVGQAEEYLQDGMGGYLVDSGAVAALVAAVGRLLADPVLAREIGDAGRDRVGELFSWRRRAADAVVVYESVRERCVSG